ncbi:MAG: Hpt domain-containing protein [Chitinophagaceae bacterium]|nr:Hpt domain-containing protein [Chitinophagaceae bacterium]
MMGTLEKLYDLTMVETISGGDMGFITKMVQLFNDTMPKNLTDLQEALKAENWEMVGKHAHKMKSTIDSMGITALKDDIRAIEHGGKNKSNVESIPALVDNVANVLGQCISQLKKDFNL